ncbi:hypothetical protein HanXRQr2_Chr03g0137141 [Helianthus annuus]|uniref:Uncharacterized protein n=1 Tax=Helianthus annuus TaxID=4232 RepID=A0A9K3JKC2_HELAN|nr:hypothetical protein HanXRQr2_Chr03g0137141 [Helianthus annuus]KAJ0945947.1 hypothetical protein HanPSC8_Chr03g0133751 [Helianthus annuus]
MWKNKPLDVSRKTDQTSGTKMTFYSCKQVKYDARPEQQLLHNLLFRLFDQRKKALEFFWS